ncbi:MAG: AraC family ligand binding domain-containing protein [Treponema sp.]|jgi:AraC-like DNA-binding protein|nr:AraC family ligand binding domain-containing protein [Treponema sp.]
MHRSIGSAGETFLRYLPTSEEDERLGMVCTTAGEYKIAPYTAYPPRKVDHPAIFRSVAEGRILPEFQMVYVTEGQGTFRCEEKTFAVRPGNVMLLLPEIKHQYRPDFETGWHEYWVGFNGGYFKQLLAQGIIPREKFFFDTGLHDGIAALFGQIFDEIRNQRPLYQFKACAGILSLLSEILAHDRRRDQPNYYQKIVERAKSFMKKNIFGAINIALISDNVGMSASRLNDIFKAYTGMAVYQYYIHLKINEALIILEEEDASIQNVALRLGFEDPCYFSRLFKNKVGVAPSKWRNLSAGERTPFGDP